MTARKKLILLAIIIAVPCCIACIFSGKNSESSNGIPDENYAVVEETAISSETEAYDSIAFPDISAYISGGGLITETFTIKVENLSVTVEKDSAAPIVEMIFSDICKLHQNLIKTIENIYITPDSLIKRFALKVPDGVVIRGMTRYSSIYLTDSLYSANVLVHEAFHTADYYYGGIHGPFIYSDEYSDFYNNYVVPNNFPPRGNYYISEYESDEYFAAMGQVWYMEPDWLKENEPFVYEFFEKHFGERFKDRNLDWELEYLQ